MNKQTINICIIGKTNAGKSTLINSLINEKISIENKKINTTMDIIAGIRNIKNTQIVFYDTPGLSFLNLNNSLKKKIKTEIFETINKVDLILFVIDIRKYRYDSIIDDLKKIHESNKPIVIVFNKIDLIKKDIIINYIDDLNKSNFVNDFFIISAKYSNGIDKLINYLVSKSKINKWKFINNEVTNKDNVFLSNECTRNAILKFLHQEVPYNISVTNNIFKILNKNNIKIKQSIEISNLRYKPIILGKKGATIKKIRETSQKEIESKLDSKIHLYLQVKHINAL